MAAMLATKRAIPSALLSKLLSPPVRSIAAAPSSVRAFNSNAQMREREDVRDMVIDRGSDQSSLSPRRADFLTDAFDPFFPTTHSLSQMLNLMDQMTESTFPALTRGVGGGPRRGLDASEDNEHLYLRIDIPGLGKDDVKVTAEQNTLIIKGEGPKEGEDEESGRKYSSGIDLPPNRYKIDGIKAEMKKGVLRIIVPKVKEEEREDVYHVKIVGDN